MAKQVFVFFSGSIRYEINRSVILKLVVLSVEDQRFPRWGGCASPLVWVKNLLFDKIFAENYMKVKEIGQRRGRPPLAPPGPPMLAFG